MAVFAIKKRWILTLLLLIAGILLILSLWPQTKEGFQYRELNIDNLKEVFLVGAYGNDANPVYSNGYTKADAAKACESKGAVLATRAQMMELQDMSANWCKVGAWTADDESNLYLANDPATTRCLLDSTFGTYTPAGRAAAATGRPSIRTRAPQDGKGFAACFGVKPAIDSDLGENVGFLRTGTPVYSYLDTEQFLWVMNGDGSDMVPFTFKPSQALYALRQTSFDPSAARTYLVNNFGGNLNSNIRAEADPATVARDTEDWRQAKQKSCEALQQIYTEIRRRLAALKEMVAAVEGKTMGVYYAKKENMNLQQQVAYVCLSQTADSSPACRRLAAIDFDIFYKAGTNGNPNTKILSDLEDLNANLAARGCEIQRALLKMQVLLENLRCQPLDAAAKAELGDYYVPSKSQYYPDSNELSICDLDKDTAWKQIFQQTGDTRFTIEKNIGYISSELLTKAFEEISPFFAAAGYTSLFTNILGNLSILLRVPTLNDYASSTTNLKVIPSMKDSIVATVSNLIP